LGAAFLANVALVLPVFVEAAPALTGVWIGEWTDAGSGQDGATMSG
jgi:hypothetical protein